MDNIAFNRIDKLPEIKRALTKVAKDLNVNNINWGLGGSLLLYLQGIDTTVNDIDIVIDEEDIKKVEELVRKYGYIEKPKSNIYLTEKFYNITIDSIDIDLMIGFKVKTGNGIYSYPKGSKLVYETVLLDNTSINVCSLKDWLEAYIAMGRINKIEIINEFYNE